ncbi:MAG: PKD domain-containing protein [Deltaproteobacteria bacterium]|nr:PKD domain-containing protein [Deltaproteobacteria bacterium]MBW2536778.1 PKD domain-containing protein [Deltaproteobacteria bacterium]
MARSRLLDALNRAPARPLGVALVSLLLAGACGSEVDTTPPVVPPEEDAGTGGSAPDAGSNLPPVASFVATPQAAVALSTVRLDASASDDPDGTIETYEWTLGDGATTEGVEVEHEYATAGCYQATLVVTDDDGASNTTSQTIVVSSSLPSGPPLATFEELPLDGSVIVRDVPTNVGVARIRGVVSSPGYHFVVAEAHDGSGIAAAIEAPLCGPGSDLPFDLELPIPAELTRYDIVVRLMAGNEGRVLGWIYDVVAGDVLLVQGQSNAVARSFDGDANVNQGPFLRSFGTRSEDPTVTSTDLEWHLAEGNAAAGQGAVGQWALRMGRALVDAHGVPLAILNGARGGQPISYFQRNDADPTDLSTNYGRLLYRVRAAGLEDGIRGILFYQGESDGTNATAHHDGFVALHEDWLDDFPSVERTYVTQIRLGCGGALPLREVQRSFADELAAVSVMSTTGLDGHDGCHYAYLEGYEALGERYGALLGRDLYEAPAAPDIEAPNPESARFSRSDGTEITLQMRDVASTLSWDPGAEVDFVLEGAAVTVTSGQASGSALVLTLSGDGRSATGLSYGGHPGAGPWVVNATGVGLLAFYDLPVAQN